MVVECPKCNVKKTIKVNEELRGKKISFTCKTENCKEKVIVQIPINPPVDNNRKTVILNTKASYSTASLFHINESGEKIKKYKISNGTNLIGRKSSEKKVDIAIDTDDKFVSRMHCTITTTNTGDKKNFILKDYQSRNDTYINNQLLGKEEEIYLQNHDIIQIGKTKLKLQIT